MLGGLWVVCYVPYCVQIMEMRDAIREERACEVYELQAWMGSADARKGCLHA